MAWNRDPEPRAEVKTWAEHWAERNFDILLVESRALIGEGSGGGEARAAIGRRRATKNAPLCDSGDLFTTISYGWVSGLRVVTRCV